MNKKEIEIRFEVKKITYKTEDGFRIMQVKLLEHPENVEIPTAEHIVSGVFINNVNIKDTYKATGCWVDTGEYGYQFKIKNAILTMPETEKGVIEFLHRNISGVGKKTATTIVEKFGISTLDIIKNKPEELLKIKNITEKKMKKISEQINTITNFEDVYVELYPLGFSATEVENLNRELGSLAITNIKDNPYLAKQLKIAPFKNCDKVAEKLGMSPTDPKRIRQGILEYIGYNLQNKGNLFVYKNFININLKEYLNNHGRYMEKIEILKEEDTDKAIKYLLDKNLIKIEKDIDGFECMYIKFYLDIENHIVRILKDMIRQKSHTLTDLEIQSFLNSREKQEIKIGKEQKEAIEMALTNKISILSGGPGTGKTFTANLVVEAIKNKKPEAIIELAAPTGKAAKRMTELTGMEAKTIHRLIGLNGLEEEEEKQELDNVEADFLIIDEASMIDAYLFYCLLSCITENTNILIIGDYQQLPSVGPGLILRDLINSKEIETTILKEVYRQAQDSQIIANAHKIINGDKNLNLDKNKGDFYFIETKSKTNIKNTIIRCIERLLETGFKINDIQVLTPTNKGDLGVVELNKAIQKKFNPCDKNKEEIKVGLERAFRVGDRVIQTENNYDLEVFNGETGIITEIKEGEIKEITVDFGDKEIVYIKDTVAQLELAYAITIHKSQGSEFKVVLTPVHSSQAILLNRNIIYTGLTRARERVVYIGDKEEFNKGIDKIDIIERNSQIREKLIGKEKLKQKEKIELPF